ncbi:preprotein translocase subunit SecE [Mesomycoplasma lagogenitalium]|uniref:Preprotein translocase subunit SecE n=1 Tax=Mesomycoplasma lagogenitalium TaxID=171286 RepID=A0ABY8LUG0_9BACT|nr:preprotein translocase subunit SecE [Mesomycoplasma lagogenitalium]WGI36872.1 preprotein translocase subunit SecE [Mesomycoplasma lagogenitalium]
MAKKKIAKKEKKYYFRNWVKEIKRVKWPDAKTSGSNFFLIILFTVITAILFLIITFVVTFIWAKMGVGF